MKRNMYFLSLRFGFAFLFYVVIVCASADADLYTPDDELLNSWGVEHIGAGLVHASGNEGAGIKIGIIDSGIDYTHPELSVNYVGGWDYVNNDNDPKDDYGHGTFVAGIIGAADNGQGIVGVAPQASLYAYKVLDNTGNGSFENVIAALTQSIMDGMDIVNMSFGSLGNPGSELFEACEQAAAAGILLVAAAGNFGTSIGIGDNILFPARYSSVIAVGATTEDDDRASFSGTGLDLELMAPGENILSTDLFGGYAYVSGTSFSAAHVTGASALFMSAGIVNVRETMLLTALDLGPLGFDTLYGYGMVNVDAAVVPTPSALVIALLGFGTVYLKRKSKAMTEVSA